LGESVAMNHSATIPPNTSSARMIRLMEALPRAPALHTLSSRTTVAPPNEVRKWVSSSARAKVPPKGERERASPDDRHSARLGALRV
jgi:hypothetical protein